MADESSLADLTVGVILAVCGFFAGQMTERKSKRYDAFKARLSECEESSTAFANTVQSHQANINLVDPQISMMEISSQNEVLQRCAKIVIRLIARKDQRKIFDVAVYNFRNGVMGNSLRQAASEPIDAGAPARIQSALANFHTEIDRLKSAGLKIGFVKDLSVAP